MSSQIQKYTINEILSLFTQSDIPEFLCDVSFLLVEESRPPIANYTRNLSNITVAPKNANLKVTKSEPTRNEQQNSQSKVTDFSPKLISKQADKQNQKSTDFITSFKPISTASNSLNKTADSPINTHNMEKENDLETHHKDEVTQNQTNDQIYSNGPIFIPQNPDSFVSNNPQDFVNQNQTTFTPENTNPAYPEFPPGFSIQDYNKVSLIYSQDYSNPSQFTNQNFEQSNQMPMQQPPSFFNPMGSSLNSENNKEQMDGFESVINTTPDTSKNTSYSNKQEDYMYNIQSSQYIQQEYQPQPFQQPQPYQSEQFQQPQTFQIPQPFQQPQPYQSDQFQQPQPYQSDQFQQPQTYQSDQFQQPQTFQILQPFQQPQPFQSDQFHQPQPFQIPQPYQPDQFQQPQMLQIPQPYQPEPFQQPEPYKQTQPEQPQQLNQKTQQHKHINFQQILNAESQNSNNQKKNENKPKNSFSPDTVVEDVKNVKIASWGNVKSKTSQQSFQEIEKSAKSDEKSHHNTSKPMIVSASTTTTTTTTTSSSSTNQKKAPTKMTITNTPNNKNEGTKSKKGNRNPYTSRPIEIPKPANFTVDNIAISQVSNATFTPKQGVVYNINQHNNNTNANTQYNSNTQTQNFGRPKGFTITNQSNNNSNKPSAFNPGNIAIPPNFTNNFTPT